LAIAAAIISTLFLPETMGKELKETIEELDDEDEPQRIQLLERHNEERKRT